jgi:hypothetical protein
MANDYHPYSQQAWEVHEVPILPATGVAFHFDAEDVLAVQYPLDHQGIYEATASIVIKIKDGDTKDFDDAIQAGSLYSRTTLPPDKPANKAIEKWIPYDGTDTGKVYNVGDLPVVVDYDSAFNGKQRFYVCLMDGVKQSKFSVALDGHYPLNIYNFEEERVVSGIRNEGFYLVPRGNYADMVYVPKQEGQLYMSKNGDGTVGSVGQLYGYFNGAWTLLTNAASWSGIQVYTDGNTITGTGTSATNALRILDAVPDFDPLKTYEEGNVVYHEIDSVKGIYKWIEDVYTVWSSPTMTHVLMNTPTLLANASEFYIDGFTGADTAKNGIYRVDPLAPAITLNVSDGNTGDLDTNVTAGNIIWLTKTGGPCQPWQPNTIYVRQNMVYRTEEGFTKLYIREKSDKPDGTTAQATFATTQPILDWRLLASAGGGGSGSGVPIGAMVGFLCHDTAQPGDPPIPSGYVRCNGALLNKDDYPRLYDVIGDGYGSTVPTQFKLPTASNQIIFTGVFV